MSPQNVAGLPGVILLTIRTSGHKAAQPSPAQPRQPCVHLQCAAGQAAVSLFMETRVDGGDIISIRYVQRLCSAVGRVQATSCQ